MLVAESGEVVEQHGDLLFKLALPKNANAPTGVFESAPSGAIPLHVTVQLCGPELRIRLGTTRSLGAMMTVPEASMYEDSCTERREYQVRSTRKIAPLQAKAET